jgi:hypothetical protein
LIVRIMMKGDAYSDNNRGEYNMTTIMIIIKVILI